MTFRPFSAAAAAAVLLAGCAINTGGIGQMRDGAPVSGSLTRDMETVTFTVLSARGWQCVGKTSANFDMAISATRTVPLTCSNGAKGNAIVAINQFSEQATMTFALDNGQEGALTFGNV